MIRRLVSSQLRLNMVSGSLTTLLNLGIVLITYPVYLHYFGYEKLGVWVVLTTVLSVAQIINIGMGPAVTKLVAEELGRHDHDAIGRYVTMAMVGTLATGSIVCVAVLLLRDPIVSAFALERENAALAIQYLPYIGLLTAYYFAVDVLNAAVAGLGRMDLANYGRTVSRGVELGVSVALLARGWGMAGLLAGKAASSASQHAINLVIIRRLADVRVIRAGNWDPKRLVRLLQFGSGVLGGSVLAMFLSPLNKLILARYAGLPSVSVYEIAYQGAMTMRSLLESALRALLPEISRAHSALGAAARREVARIHWRAVGFLLVLGVPLCLVVMGGAEVLLKLWLRHRFNGAIPPAFRIIAAGGFLNLLAVPAYFMLMGLGRLRQWLISHVISSGVNVAWMVGAVLAGGRITADTGAWAFFAGYTATAVYVVWQYRLIMRGQFQPEAGPRLAHPGSPRRVVVACEPVRAVAAPCEAD